MHQTPKKQMMSAFHFGLARAGYHDITPRDLTRLPSGVRYVDVREAQEFDGELGHLPNAELVPLGSLTRAAKDWNKETPIVLICRSGRRSADGAEALSQMGFRDVANLAGGMLAVRGKS